MSYTLSPEDIEELAAAIHERMARAVLQLPSSFKDNVQKQWQLAPIQIPFHDPINFYFLLYIHITKLGGMVMRITDYNGELIKEWVME